MVKVMEIDGQGRINLSRKALLGGGSGNGEFTPRAPRAPRDVPTPAAAPAGMPAAADAPGAPPMRRRRRPHGRDDE